LKSIAFIFILLNAETSIKKGEIFSMKRIIRSCLGLIIVFSMVSCATAEITKRVYKPVPGGTVKYSESLFSGNKSRTLAEQQMSGVCNGRNYEIVSESNGTELGPVKSTTSADGKVNINQSSTQYTYIDFICSK
jgi:hypothetical protein